MNPWCENLVEVLGRDSREIQVVPGSDSVLVGVEGALGFWVGWGFAVCSISSPCLLVCVLFGWCFCSYRPGTGIPKILAATLLIHAREPGKICPRSQRL